MRSLGLSSSVPGIDKRVAAGGALVAGVLSILLPIAVSIYGAWHHNWDNQIHMAHSIAQDVLRKGGESMGQMEQVFGTLSNAPLAAPCSAERIRLMGQLSLQSEQVQVVGYVQGNVLRCSAYGPHHIPLGVPTFTTALGTQVWTAKELPLLPGARFLIVVPKGVGYAVVMLPHTLLNVFADNPDISMGLYSLSAQQLITSRGIFRPQWLERLGAAQQVQFIDGEHFVAMRRSERFEFASYVVQPAARVHQGLYDTALVLVPLGVFAGGVLGLMVWYLARQQLALPAVIKVALKRKEFTLHYQPIVDLKTGAWVGAEALLRWRQPSGQMVPPDVFIKAAEDAGLIEELTAQVLEMVGRDAAHFFASRPDFHIAINLSAADLGSRRCVAALTRLVAQTAAGPSNLLVEATERGFMTADVVQANLRDIRAMGIDVAIDDFGTGYSSLSYLETFVLDYLKIDKSFVDTLCKDAATSQVVPHIIEMAKSLQLRMIAEGVETPEQAQYLRERGVQLAQGWLFAKPMPFAQLLAGCSPCQPPPAARMAAPV